MVCTPKLCICIISRVFFPFLWSLFRLFCMQILSPPLTFILSYTFLLWTHSFFSHHYARLYSITPIGSLTRTFLLPSAFFIFFNAQWHSRVFIAAGECPGRCNFNSIVSCIRGMIYAMHSRSCVHAHSATGHEEDRRCASALSGLCRRRVRYLNGVVPFSFFLSFFFIYSAFASTTDRARRFIDWKSKSEFNFGESLDLYSLRFIFFEKSIAHLPLYISILVLKYLILPINATRFLYLLSKLNLADTRDGVIRGRLAARSRSVIWVTSLRFNDESWLFIDLFARIQKGRASGPLSRVSDVGTHPGEIRWGRGR